MIVSGLGFGSTGAISRSIDADAWQIASWRGLIGGTGALAYVWLRGRRPKLRTTLGPQGLLMAALAGLSMFLYIDALQRTEVANVTVISATVPFLAAGLAWLILRERLRRSTVVAAVVAVAGVTLTVAGNLGPGDLDGNLRAVVLALVLALLIVLIRRFEGADAVLALGSAGVLLFVVALAVADPLGVAADQTPLIVIFGLVFAVSLVLWTEGVRLIPAAEAGLLGSSETPFSILLAWIVLSEAPPLATVAGGLLVLGAVLGHAGADLAHNRVSRPWLRPRAAEALGVGPVSQIPVVEDLRSPATGTSVRLAAAGRLLRRSTSTRPVSLRPPNQQVKPRSAVLLNGAAQAVDFDSSGAGRGTACAPRSAKSTSQGPQTRERPRSAEATESHAAGTTTGRPMPTL